MESKTDRHPVYRFERDEPKYDDRLYLEAIEEKTRATTSEVRRYVSERHSREKGPRQTTARARLNALEERYAWVSQTKSGRECLWELTDRGRAHLEELRDGEVAHAATTDAQDENNDASDTRRDDEQEGGDV